METPELDIAVVIPCYNEAVAIGAVVDAFRASLPRARIVVFDNNSTDGTADVARRRGAEVRIERMQGKGNVVRSMFAKIDADIYLMADGDATYDASAAPGLVQRLVDEDLDLVVGTRVTSEQKAYRSGHQFGNRALTSLTGWIFGRSFTDMLSGYRVMSRRFAKSFPAHAQGFDTEVELAVHALELRLGTAEVPTRYFSRPEGSHSKLNTYRDGWRILKTIVRMTKNGKPLAFFSTAGFICALVAVGLALPLIATYMQTGLVPRFPTAILSASLVLLGSIFLVCGLVLDTVTLGRREQKYANYLLHAKRATRSEAPARHSDAIH
ncbi:Glycosyltransferase involved in cell wall bisynthesis [Luteibacter sp. UNC138MFCol5.1]|uniref:glycosyltransferase family 2 protein n=1 Tax=Luteibacter sp. UNC138MFCol5.1 TaxID=1502774 RepID=UPI0008AB05C9|nr:glycosyltransferase family 2 protein [Luteibacter sp. UNC138MFCol5.1]SEP06589.1 Glycosyltransferase involved in cell wall bisynthesis [Luteibacter sp. UNC138MFCol5.1]